MGVLVIASEFLVGVFYKVAADSMYAQGVALIPDRSLLIPELHFHGI